MPGRAASLPYGLRKGAQVVRFALGLRSFLVGYARALWLWLQETFSKSH